jgi:hypothetical protein
MLIFEEYLNKFLIGYNENIKFIFNKNKQNSMNDSCLSFAKFLFERKEVPFNDNTMRWITVKDANMQNQHILVKKKDGTIIGGEHDGEKLEDVFKDVEDEKNEKKVHRNGFFVNGKEYYHSFGKYYCDEEKITREDGGEGQRMII